MPDNEQLAEQRGRDRQRLNHHDEAIAELRREVAALALAVSELAKSVAFVRQVFTTISIITALIWAQSEKVAAFVRGVFR